MAPLISGAAADRRRILRLMRGEELTEPERVRAAQAAVREGLGALLEPRAPELAGAAVAVRFAAIHGGAFTVRAVRALEAAGIEALVLKGLAIAALAWPDPSSRPQSDVDLLVRRADERRAIEALQAAGLAGEVLIAGEAFHETKIAPAAGGAMIELHHALADDALLDVDLDELFARAMPIDTPDGPVRTLGLEDAAVFLAVHAAGHLLERLVWLVDLQGLAERQPVDWQAAAERARRWDASLPVWIAWRTAADVLGAPIPGPALDAIRPGAVRRAVASGLLRTALAITYPARRPLSVAFRLTFAASPAGAVLSLRHKVKAVREKRRS